MSLVKIAIKMAVKTPRIENFDRYLFVGPHPDDIEIGAGATVSKLVEMGKQVTFLICTDGRFGDGASDGVKGDELARLRREESIESAALLGVTDVRFLNLMDGACYEYNALLKGIAETVASVSPDIIFAPDPTPKSECHPDHINVGNAVKTIACLAPYDSLMSEKFKVCSAQIKALVFYMTARPNRFIGVMRHFNKQLSAVFDCHKSQYPANSAEAASLKLYLKLRYIQYGCKEGFRVYSQTHMHCLPEA